MKRLFLYRHAKSSWDDPTLGDFDRPLAPRGVRAAVQMARVFAEREWLPGRIVVSPAERTRRTWALGAPLLPGAPEPVFLEALYMASPARLLECVRDTPKGIETLLLLGHNPGLEQFAARLAGSGSDARARDRMVEKFPTAAVALLEFEGDWQQLSWSAARLTHFLRPKDLD